jgi:hypothetical protein
MKLIVILLTLVTMCGCSKKQDFGCADQLKNRVPIGTTLEAAEAAVKECEIEYSIDSPRKVLHALKRGEKKGMTQENRAVVIQFDEDGRVSSIDVKPEFTGP